MGSNPFWYSNFFRVDVSTLKMFDLHRIKYEMPWQQTAFGAFTKCIERGGIEGKCMRAHGIKECMAVVLRGKAKSPQNRRRKANPREFQKEMCGEECTFKGSFNERANPLK